jgi:HK97 family phage portal protein
MSVTRIKIFGIPVYSREQEQRDASVSNLKSPKDWLKNIFGVTSNAGVEVNESSVGNLLVAYRSVDLLANVIASLPKGVFEVEPNGDKKKILNHDAAFALRRPNQKMTEFVYFQTVLYQLLTRGNSYSRIITSRDGYTLKLYDNQEVSVYEHKDRLYYRFHDKNTPARLYTSDEVMHFKGLGDGVIGKNPIQSAREGFATAIAAQSHGNHSFKNGSMPPGYYSTPEHLNNEAYERLKNDLVDSRQGVTSANKTPLLEGGMEFKNFALSLEDLQFIQTREFTNAEVAGFFGVPLHLVYSAIKQGGYNSFEQFSTEFVKFTVMPWVRRIEEELERKLFTLDEQRAGNYAIKFNLKGLLRGDIKSQTEFYDKMLYHGVFNKNDVRRLEDINSTENGDEFYVDLNKIPEKMVDQYYKSKMTNNN